MSEQIELGDSNLCISEDAFEKFQAISMYEENKYITLPHAVPTKPPESEPSEGTKITSCSDTMVKLNSDDKVYVNTPNCGSEPQIPPKCELAASTDSSSASQLPSKDSNRSTVTPKHGKKRVRKKKTITESSEKTSEGNSECVNTEDSTNGPSESIEDIQNFIQTTEPEFMAKSQEKNSKHYNIHCDDLTPSKEKSKKSISDTPIPPSRIETALIFEKRLPKRRVQSRRSLESSSMNMSSSNEDENAVVKVSGKSLLTSSHESSKRKLKKRGRPKKISEEEVKNQTESVDTVDNPMSPDELDSLPEVVITKQPRKRGRPKKNSKTKQFPVESGSENNVSSQNASLEYDDDDICLSKMTSKKSDSDNRLINEDKLELNDLLEFDSDRTKNDNEKCEIMNKKRGRPRKAVTETVSQATTDNELQADSSSHRKSHEDADEVSLSEFKKALEAKDAAQKINIQQPSEEEVTSTKNDEHTLSSGKRNSKMPIMSDFEYNLDSIVSENMESEKADTQKYDLGSLLVEDTSRRPTRKKMRQTLQYHEESDEDPFANVELSDDEPQKKRKSRRYNSDDEYFPGDKKGPATPSSSDSELNTGLDTEKKNRKRKFSRKSDSQSPRKRGRKPIPEKILEIEETSEQPLEDDLVVSDIEDCLHSSVIKTNDETSKAWGTTKEFENFLAKKIQGTNLKIKKVSSSENADVIAPLQIPTIDPNEVKKTIEMCTQTRKISTSNVHVQTGSLYDIPMKETVALTSEQAEKSCEFLSSIVNTTAELGKLMTQKSEDFIKKKINTAHVTDTFKMDYCVRKSFLLFKLAKHNLTQMEEDLGNQYERFLHEHDLLKYREEPKKILPRSKVESDSDCEIVEVPQEVNVNKTTKYEKFNPKTVFLNKELSIKIAKKPSDDKKINIKGKHTVWINDSVMVKKVKPTQSFLAQDSRNKKPPDQNYVTTEMVRDFFDDYYRKKKSLATCALFTSPDWLNMNNIYVCNYFVTKQDFAARVNNNNETATLALNSTNTSASTTDLNQNLNIVKTMLKSSQTISPQQLITLCTKVLLKILHTPCFGIKTTNSDNDNSFNIKKQPTSLIKLCINLINNTTMDKNNLNPYMHNWHAEEQRLIKKSVPTLKSFCLKKVSELYFDSITSHETINTSARDHNLENSHSYKNNEHVIIKQQQRNIKSLFSLCVDCFQLRNNSCMGPHSKATQQEKHIKSLFSLCFESIRYISGSKKKTLEPICLQTNNYQDQVIHNKTKENKRKCKSLFTLCIESINLKYIDSEEQTIKPAINQFKGNIKTLFSLCVECIQDIQMAQKHVSNKIDLQFPPSQVYTPKSLKQIGFKYMLGLLFNNEDYVYINQAEALEPIYANDLLTKAFTINSVNTMSEEAFHNLENTAEEHYYDDYNNEESYLSNDDYESHLEMEEHELEDNNWASQVQMKELRSCANINAVAQHIENDDVLDIPHNVAVKTEPIDDVSENMHTFISVKIEPLNELDEMSMIPDNVYTKSEISVNSQVTDHSPRLSNTSYPVDTFEEFVRTSKILNSCDNEAYTEVYSQSNFRVRKQFEPDYNGENEEIEKIDGLLVPHTYTNIYRAKDCLMESSSDERNTDKSAGKKKPAKRKAKPKKNITKTSSKYMAPPVKGKSKLGASEVDEFTRKMKDRIRQEQNDRQSSESETEDLPFGNRRNKDNVKDTDKKLSLDKSTNNAIQCNDVDSTEQIGNPYTSTITNDDATNGSSNSVEQNDSSNTNNAIKTRSQRNSRSSCDFDGPLELLECEPTIHEHGDNKAKSLLELLNKSLNDCVTEFNNTTKESNNEVTNDQLQAKESTEIVNRCGWSCYPINTKDTKLYRDAFVLLEKLPESFVQTYFQYQEITKQTEMDKEIDRLTNVNSLKRFSKDKDKPKIKLRIKNGVVENCTSIQKDTNSDDSEQAYEFTPSEDDEAHIDIEIPPLMPQRHADNILAKSSLMDDETDEEKRVLSPKPTSIKREPADEAPVTKRPGPKSKTRVEPKIPEGELILTADKMMKEELTLLHAPVNMESTEANGDADTMHKESVIRTRSKGHKKMDYKIKFEDDSSSEEEKQWVNTKEKLLKRLKKAPDASVSDAKRAKMVTEFIEKRGDGSEKRKMSRVKYRASKKKFLEREKQVKVLSKELYGESSSDAVHPRKSYVNVNYKGRRNIRKVIDKKSLEISTLKANIEELERKRRLNDRQSQLREHLGCEDNVNVLVINDEVCLEYDFDEDQPAVTVHAFFTKVMKAHQYEGVKFMWDACFESVSKVRSGHAGGGCILAHCMGLGKTLQVLALLHTVLTHPQVGMKRVLVCCPLSTVLNWVDEIHKWIGPVTDRLKVFELSKLKKTYERAYQLEDWYNGGGIFIIGYELFRSLTTLDPGIDHVRPTIVKKIRTALLDPGPDIVVCDEGHLLKNDCSVLAVAMSRVATRRRIVLTGTPMQNNLREYYCMVNFIKPNLLGSYAEYSNRFANPIMNGQHRDSSEEDIKLMKTRTHILHKVLEGCLQRQEASVLYPYLPKKHEYTVFIPLTKCQWDLYKHYIYTYCKQNKQSILKDFHILQKIWSHPQVLHNFHTKLNDYKRTKEEKLEDDLAAEDLAVDDIKPTDTEVWWLQYLDGGNMLESLESSNKFVAVFRILNECVALGDKVLIFSTSLFCLDTLEYFLKKINSWSLGQEYYRLDGSVPAEVRHKWCREFNADNNVKTKLFLISTRAGSLGLNMTAANRVIILDTSWNPAHDMQSIFRVYRFGQKKDCFIYRLVAMGTMEQKIYERSVTKQAVACRVVDEQQIDRHYNSADLAELYRLDEAGGSVSGGVAAGVRDVALLRVARDGPVHAVHEHDSLLRASEPALPEHERAAAWHQFQLERAAQQTNVPTTKKSKISAKSLQNAKPKTVIQETTEIEPQEPQTSKSQDVTNDCMPSTSAKPVFFADDSIKNEIANNVVHALIKHNFPNMVDIKDVTAVVNAVQIIVRQVEANEENKIDITTVIARVMFENVNVPLPQLVNIVMQNLNANLKAEKETVETKVTEQPVTRPPLPQKKSERLKEKEHQLRTRSSLRHYKLHKTLPETGKSTKKKKKNVSQKKTVIADTTDVIIDKKNNDLTSCEISKTISMDECVEIKEKPGPLSKKKGKKDPKRRKQLIDVVEEQPEPICPVEQLKPIDAVQQPEPNNAVVQPQAMSSEYSILLSDDDDVTLVQTNLPLKMTSVTAANRNSKPEQVKQATPNVNQQRVNPRRPNRTIMDKRRLSASKERAECEIQDSEPVPLHPSLLTNKNFITIVAHKYLEATPLLDEDAATLAAQYSTQKAKKEMEETGKSITSGPLYDIAVNLLGIETLKKLNKVTPRVTKAKRKESAPMMPTQETVNDLVMASGSRRLNTGNTQSSKPAAKAPPTKQLTTKKASTPVAEKPTKSADPAPAPPTTASITTSNVVPVELFKGPSITASNQCPQQNIEECILPDDDDTPSTFAGVPSLSQQTSAPSNSAAAKAVPNQKKPIILRKILAKTTPRLQPVSIQTATNAPKSSPVGELKSMISAVDGQIVVDASQLNNTICLDSDDDEPGPGPGPVPGSLPGPVPVAITRVNPQQLIPITRISPKQVMPVSRIVASAAPASSTSSFVIVPAGSSVNTSRNSVNTPISVYTQSSVNTPLLYTVSTPSSSFLSPSNISPAIVAVSGTSTSSILTKPVISSSSSPHKTDQMLPITTVPDTTLATKSQKPNQNQFILKINNQTLKVVQTSPPLDSVKNLIKLGKNDQEISNAVNKDPPVSGEPTKKEQSSTSTRPSTKKADPAQSSQSVSSKKSIEPSTSRRSTTTFISDDSDTPSSSNVQPDDPLDILKDIVHIQAYTNEKDRDEKATRNKGKTTKDIKSSTNKAKSTSDATKLQFNLKNMTEVKTSTCESAKPPTYRKIAAKPSSTELVLRFTTDAIKSSSNTLKKHSTGQASTSTKSSEKVIMKAKEILNLKLDNLKAKNNAKAAQNVIDLTSHVAEPNKNNSKNTKKHLHNKLNSSVINLADTISSIENPALELAKNALTNIVDITGESSKGKSGTRTKSTAQHTSTNDKKRPSTSIDTKPIKKKKIKELTLQDFNIDDLDDIIELE